MRFSVQQSLVLLSAAVLSTCFHYPARALADVVKVNATVTPVQDRVAESAVVILNFSIPVLREGTGRTIQSAVVEWTHAEIPEDDVVRYRAYASTEALQQGDAPGRTTLQDVLEEVPIEQATAYPQDYGRLGHGRFRFVVTEQVEAALERQPQHLQIVIATQDMTPQDLSSGEAIPVLTVRYGFLGEAAASFKLSRP
jgi:hypothetical protein